LKEKLKTQLDTTMAKAEKLVFDAEEMKALVYLATTEDDVDMLIYMIKK
jgi:hypothetical protein